MKPAKYNHKKIALDIRNKISNKRIKWISTNDVLKYTNHNFSHNSLNFRMVEVYFAKISGVTSDSCLNSFSCWKDDKNRRIAINKIYKINI